MAYETTLTITLNVDGGPPAMKESSKIDGVAGVFSKRVSFCSKIRSDETSCTCKDEKGNVRVLRVKKLELGALECGVETLSFISLKASRYVYKRCNAKIDPEGIGYSFEPCPAPVGDKGGNPPMCNVNFIRNEKVLVSFPGCDSLNGKTKIYLYVDEELFDCSKKDPDEVILTVTWGVVSKKETAAEMCAASC